MSLYDNDGFTIHLSDLPVSSVDSTTYSVNGQQVTEQEYNNFISGKSPKTKILKLDDNERDSVSALLADQANKKGLRGQAFSDYVENGIIPAASSRSSSAKGALSAVKEDKEITSNNIPSQASDIVTALKQSSENQAQIMVSLVEGLNHL